MDVAVKGTWWEKEVGHWSEVQFGDVEGRELLKVLLGSCPEELERAADLKGLKRGEGGNAFEQVLLERGL